MKRYDAYFHRLLTNSLRSLCENKILENKVIQVNGCLKFIDERNNVFSFIIKEIFQSNFCENVDSLQLSLERQHVKVNIYKLLFFYFFIIPGGN